MTTNHDATPPGNRSGARDVFWSLSSVSDGAHLEYDHILSHTLSIMADTARVTVTLPADLVESIDRLERNRSRFISEAVAHELARRRQEALLHSIRSPHADTVALVDTGLADWVSDLAADEGLVDVTGGTPVRWIEGRGWKKDRV
jgi:post-segregation antitoxin (ccd killing protein)